MIIILWEDSEFSVTFLACDLIVAAGSELLKILPTEKTVLLSSFPVLIFHHDSEHYSRAKNGYEY